MEKLPLFESKETVPITPESVLAEIRSRFANSRELYNHLKEMVDKNYAMSTDKPETPSQAADVVLDRLASYRRRGTQIDGIPFEHVVAEQVDKESVENAFKSGALLGLLASSVYYGEATFISKEGQVLPEPMEM